MQLKKGKKNKFTRRKDKVSFEVYETTKPSFSQIPWAIKKQYAFPDSWNDKDKDEYFEIKTTTNPEMKLLKTLNFLNNRPESYFEHTHSEFANDPFRTDPPGFSNV